MASFIFDSALQGFMGVYNYGTDAIDLAGGQRINWLEDTIKVVLIDTDDYTVDPTHSVLADVAAAARVATENLGAVYTDGSAGQRTIAPDGWAQSPDVTFSALAGDELEAIIIYKEGADEANSPLIAYIDSTTATNLPVTPNNGDFTLRFTNGDVFKL